MRVHKRNRTFIYRRRVPKLLQSYIQMTEFKRTLVPDPKLSKLLAQNYDTIFMKMMASIKLGFGIEIFLKELGLLDRQVEQNQESHVTLSDVIAEFIHSKKDIASTSLREYKQQTSLLQHLLPENLDILTYKHIDKVKDILQKLPKRNIQKYRDMTFDKLIRAEVKECDRISIKSKNEYLKTLRALLLFAEERKHIHIAPTIKLLSNKTTARNQRKILTKVEVKLLTDHKDHRMASMSTILFYTGMRLSEVYKAKIRTLDDVMCFDLTDMTIGLKTDSSYRIIPIHKDIVGDIERLHKTALSSKDKWHTRLASKLLNSQGKTLYSLRHTFATQLASMGTEEHIISELLGHAHQSMTMNRYVKGFPINKLKEAVDNLSI